MVQKDVFISYKAEEFDDANWVKSTLENNGISCWMAPMSIPGGSSYATEIPQAIRQCKVFVLILSEKSQKSKWVPRELDQAINENKTVMPFMLENCALKDDFNFYLTNVQRYAAFENKSNAIEKMIDEIRAIIGLSCDMDKKEQIVETIYKSEDIKTSQLSEKITKTKRPQKISSKKVKKSEKRKISTILKIVGPAVVGIIFVIAWYINCTHIKIAGINFSVYDSYIQISNAELSDTDMKLLGKFKNIWSLRFESCTFTSDDLSPLSIPGLQTLSLYDCHLNTQQINSINFSAMNQLSVLDMSGNKDLTSLEKLLDVSDTLTILKISNTSITEIDSIAQFHHLTQFCSDNNSLTNIDGVASCTELSILSLNGNKISDLTPLSNCSMLTELYINSNELTSLYGLEYCIELQKLQAGSNKIESLSALANATLLRTVFLNDNRIEEISILAKSGENLQQVYLRNNKVKEIEAFSFCPSLTYLNIDNNNVSTLLPIANCTQLIAVSASGNQLTSMSGLEKKPNLVFLNLENNQIYISETDEFSFSTNEMLTVELSGNNIIDLKLHAACRYKYLGLRNNPISRYENIYQTTGLNIALDYSDRIDFVVLSSTGYSNYCIVNCPLDKQVAVRDQLGKYSTNLIVESEDENMIEPYTPDLIKGVIEYYH